MHVALGAKDGTDATVASFNGDVGLVRGSFTTADSYTFVQSVLIRCHPSYNELVFTSGYLHKLKAIHSNILMLGELSRSLSITPPSHHDIGDRR